MHVYKLSLYQNFQSSLTADSFGTLVFSWLYCVLDYGVQTCFTKAMFLSDHVRTQHVPMWDV